MSPSYILYSCQKTVIMVDIYVVYNTNYTPEMWWLVQCVTCTTVHGTFAVHFQAVFSTPP